VKLENAWKAHPDKPEETLESTWKALCFAAAGTPLSAQKAVKEALPTLDSEAEKRLASLIEQRCSGIPLAHITGRQQYMGVEMLASPAALIPRVETEILGSEVVRIAGQLIKERGEIIMVDVCTGCGNIILGVMSKQPGIKGFGSDLSPEAVELARKNAGFTGFGDKVEFFQGDLFKPFESERFLGQVDIITCNPPYISTNKAKKMDGEISRHEPLMAFNGGPFGFTVLTGLIKQAVKFLKPDSYLCFEIGLGQGQFVERMVRNSELYREIRTLTDSQGEVRAFLVRV
jgi:release factor glutamine methyltransferase